MKILDYYVETFNFYAKLSPLKFLNFYEQVMNKITIKCFLFLFLTTVSVFSQELTNIEDIAEIKNSKASIHSERNPDSKIIKWVGYGDRISVSSVPLGEWYKVYLSPNQSGWIYIDEVQLLPNPIYIKRCEATLENLAPVRGIKLGMTKKEVLSKYELADTTDFYIDKRSISLDALEKVFIPFEALTISNEQIPKEYGEGLLSLTIRFVDDRVVEFVTTYDNSITWVSYDELITRINEIYKLPSQVWSRNRANCGNYQIVYRCFSKYSKNWQYYYFFKV